MSRSYSPSLFKWHHPWDWVHLESCSDYELRGVYDQIDRAFQNGDIPPLAMDGVRRTERRIKRMLQIRNAITSSPWEAWDTRGIDLEGVGVVGFLHRASPSVVIGQTVQQENINIQAPRPNITFQTISASQPNVNSQTVSAPPQNINLQTIQAPLPAAALPAPELPKRIRFRDQWGNIVEERDETEQEKSDREFKEWKEKFGVE
ncbi:hypothetical protein G6011_03396 [Alternaria panax]|uniref:Uncharacterized protein n=1 Tax=Alternaria panax TaxID=48097 RepID=A0AAD4IEN0_9PLEO|nr:hypothetical protein G6011_03396 [Alternaria panax]